MSAIPGRGKILASSLVFVVASIVLLFELICLKAAGTGYFEPPTPDFLNGMGITQGLLWFLGFAILIDWLVFDTFPVWGASRRALLGATLKLIASVCFTIQPASAAFGYLQDAKGPCPSPAGVPWSNFLGILFFHTGNCIDAIGSLPMLDVGHLCSMGNLPVYGILTYCAATWVLVIGDGFAFVANSPPFGAGKPMSPYVAPANVVGSIGLLLGSLIYTWWAACFGRGGKRHGGPMMVEPLVNVMPQ